MARRYSEREKIDALARLAASGDDVAAISAQTGIPASTLRGWLRRGRTPDEALNALREQLIADAAALADSLIEVIDDAPLHQRATALNQLVDKIIRLAEKLPPDQREEVIRIEYIQPDGSVRDTPPWAADDPQ